MGPDRSQLVSFYADAFGWTFEHHDEMDYSIFRVGEGGIGGGIGQNPDKRASVSIYAEVDDLDGKLKQAKDLGALNVTDPMDVGPESQIAVVEDPAGNAFGLYAGTTTQDPPKGSGDPVVWFDILGSDNEGLKRFYTGLFGWELDVSDDGYAHVQAVRDGIGGGISTPHPGMPSNALLIYILSANIEESLAKIGSAGGTSVMGRTSVSDGIDIGLFKDPAGNLVGLCEYTS